MVTVIFRRKRFFRWWPLVVIAAVLFTFCLVAGRVSAQESGQHMMKHQTSGMKHSSSKMMSENSKLSYEELRSWVGRWEGTAGPDGKETPVELVWTPAVSGEWLEGHLRVWGDKSKKTETMNALMFVHPTGVAGQYKLDAVDNRGDVETGKATVNGTSMEWSWDFDNGSHETLTTNYPFNGKVTYTGSMNEKGSQTPEEIRYILSKK